MSICAPLAILQAAATQPATLPASAIPAAPTTAPMLNPVSIPASLIFAGAMIGWFFLVALVGGVFSPRGRIDTPDRIEPRRSAVPQLVILFLGGGVWLAVQMVFGSYQAAAFHHQHPGETFSIARLRPWDLAFLSTVPALLGFAVLTVGDAVTGLTHRLGYILHKIPLGVAFGVLAAIGVLPLILGAGALLELLYRQIHFHHPAEHELLGAMKEATPAVRIVLVIGACVIAPLFEELLFRGHIQTLLRHLFAPRGASHPPPLPLAALGIEDERMAPMEGHAPGFAKPQADNTVPVSVAPNDSARAIDYATPGAAPSRYQRYAWLAILITSLLFASVHPVWMAPLIFILSLCLGYLYERTGNLWACIVLHAIFNSTSTFMFLST